MFHDDRQRTTAIGIWIASYSAGGAIGTLAGGLPPEKAGMASAISETSAEFGAATGIAILAVFV